MAQAPKKGISIKSTVSSVTSTTASKPKSKKSDQTPSPINGSIPTGSVAGSPTTTPKITMVEGKDNVSMSFPKMTNVKVIRKDKEMYSENAISAPEMQSAMKDRTEGFTEQSTYSVANQGQNSKGLHEIVSKQQSNSQANRKTPKTNKMKFYLILGVTAFIAFTITLLIILYATGAFDSSEPTRTKPINGTEKNSTESISITRQTSITSTDKAIHSISTISVVSDRLITNFTTTTSEQKNSSSKSTEFKSSATAVVVKLILPSSSLKPSASSIIKISFNSSTAKNSFNSSSTKQ